MSLKMSLFGGMRLSSGLGVRKLRLRKATFPIVAPGVAFLTLDGDPLMLDGALLTLGGA